MSSSARLSTEMIKVILIFLNRCLKWRLMMDVVVAAFPSSSHMMGQFSLDPLAIQW